MHSAARARGLLLPGAVGGLIVALNLLQACSFTGRREEILRTPAGVYELINEAPFTLPSSSRRWTVFEEAGRIKVEHGTSCAELPRAIVGDHLGTGIVEIAELEDGYAGTVFLNGWQLEYPGTDHNVVGLGSTIFNVYQAGNQLLWNAGGILTDKNGDDRYDWCYSYTLLSWPKDSTSIDVDAVHSEPSGKLMFVDGDDAGAFGVVHAIPGTYRSKGKRPRKRKAPRARLLAGFGMAWTDNDHNVLQVGFDLGPQTISGRRIDWTSKAVLKDNAANRDFRSADIVTILRGASVSVSQPATVTLESGGDTAGEKPNTWTLAPRTTSSCPNVGAPGARVYHYAIPGLRHRWAIPMLTGWDVGDVCNDNNVRRVGAVIEDFDYEPPTAGQLGTLRYTVRTSFYDNDGYPGLRDQLKVSVLGINPVRNGGVIPVPVPIEPSAGS